MRNGQNEVLVKYDDYLNHQPQTITDAAGKQSHLTYNAHGQVETAANAKGEVTKFVYQEDVAAPEYGRVLTVSHAFGTVLAATTTYTYDNNARVQTVTDSDNYTVTIAYDAIGGDPLKTLDRVVRTT